MKYAWMYRLGFAPWERYGPVAKAKLQSLLARVAEGSALGRALDLGCGRGQFTPELARYGWEAVGVDIVPEAIRVARENSPVNVTYVVGDVTDLAAAELGVFELFIDIGCFQGLKVQQRAAQVRSVTALAAPGANLLMLAFGDSRYRRLVEGVAPEQVIHAFHEWELISVENADTAGLGWPMNQTSPKWYWFQLPNDSRSNDPTE